MVNILKHSKNNLNREQSKIVQLNKRNEARRFELYEQYVSGEIDTDAYNRMTERITVVEKRPGYKTERN